MPSAANIEAYSTPITPAPTTTSEPVVAWVFILALGLLGVSLVYLALEVRFGLGEFELYR